MNSDFTPFEKLLVSLAENKVVFMTVGGVACALSGFVRTTDDVDLLVEPAPDNIDRLLQTLCRFGQGYARELTPADFTDEEGAVRIIEDFPIDLFVRMGGRHFKDLLPYRQWIELGGVPVPYLGAEGLILLKQDSVRDKDKIDVAALRERLDQRPK
ncbi:MAG: hypothetical protein R6X19_11990 [Kiritimatiellia bacterium]